jgi:hypothetical protein
MPAVLINVAKSLVLSLFTEAMLKWVIIWSLEKVVERTKETWDDELLAKAKEVWSIKTN